MATCCAPYTEATFDVVDGAPGDGVKTLRGAAMLVDFVSGPFALSGEVDVEYPCGGGGGDGESARPPVEGSGLSLSIAVAIGGGGGGGGGG